MDLDSKLKDGLKMLKSDAVQFGIGALGFYTSVDAKWISNPANAGTTYPFNTQGASDFLAAIFGSNVAQKVTGVAGAASQTFKPFGWLNKGALLAVGAYIAKETIDGDLIDALADVAIPFGVGYSAGGIFDANPAGTTPGSNRGMYNSANQGGNALQAVLAANRRAVRQ